jgi:hypothetical protein
MPDLSALFDEIGHLLLLTHLRFSFGIAENALNWAKSHLANITHCVSVEDKTSPGADIHFGGAQRSVLGPKNYCLYIELFDEIIKLYYINYAFGFKAI